MKEVADTKGGWMHYLKNVTTALAPPLTDVQYELVMKRSIGGKPYNKAPEELQNAGN